jgi:prefoldin subunit 5
MGVGLFLEGYTMEDKLSDSFKELMNTLENQMNELDELSVYATPKKHRRVRKVKSSDMTDATITPVANGYTVQSTTTGSNVYVFETIDKAFDFIKGKMKPTAEQSEFLEKV